MSFAEITGDAYTELLAPRVAPGTSVLDVGCATGYAFNSLEPLGVSYPALDRPPAAAERQLVLRTFLGEREELHAVPSPVREFAAAGFTARVARDECTDSLPRLVDEAVRTFYVAVAERAA